MVASTADVRRLDCSWRNCFRDDSNTLTGGYSSLLAICRRPQFLSGVSSWSCLSDHIIWQPSFPRESYLRDRESKQEREQWYPLLPGLKSNIPTLLLCLLTRHTDLKTVCEVITQGHEYPGLGKIDTENSLIFCPLGKDVDLYGFLLFP